MGKGGQKTAVMEVKEEFGIDVHALVTVRDVREYLADSQFDPALIATMDAYMADYCI